MKFYFMIISLLISNYVYSQEFERVTFDYNLTDLMKPNDLFLIDHDRLYLTTETSATIFDADLNIIGQISSDRTISKIWFAKTLDGLAFTALRTYTNEDSRFYSRIDVTQTLFNNDEYYEALIIKDDAVYLQRLKLSTYNNGVESSNVDIATLQTILPPDDSKFFQKGRTYVFSTNSGNYIAIPTINRNTSAHKHIFYKINKSGSTPISRGVVLSSNPSEIKYYDLSGKLIENPVKGINIIRYGDGTVEKKVFK